MKCIIFDFDGVLIETTKAKYDSMLELAEFAQSGLSLKLCEKLNSDLMGATRGDICDWILKEINKYSYTKEQLLTQFQIILDLNTSSLTFSYEVKKMLTMLKSKNINLYIVSMAPINEIKKYIGDTSEVIEEIFGSEMFSGSSKSQVLKKIMMDKKYKNNDIIFIGDTPSDMLAANKNEIKFIRIESFIGNKCNWSRLDYICFNELKMAYDYLLEQINVS
ncbi:HAD hydrolase-like protein [Silvanigrella paludirubra]|uniref:phosphoglycolate phosphatase n=1 Tax=Silvanigrella paludirubra TaxID=2499159 RepID=A0A6N6VUP7_9BACT|nr:HAD hydrolase-like protein [Silvanigrella paludirubra]KAB8036821.1 HAD hydrolase-like protein [Silvanigrella paludirubra]